jgi:subtilisin-like proprotein convertase family protein/V8-like Glu-specific endopeptidase
MKKLTVTSITIFAIAIIGCGDEVGKKKKTGDQEVFDYNAKVIYGEDNRLDIYEVQDRALLKLADSTVALMSKNDLTQNGSTTQINVENINDSIENNYGKPLCAAERFRNQVTAAFCSGFLVAPNIIVTAGHCIESEGTPTSDCATTRFVFGFKMSSANDRPNSVPTQDVYSCKKIIKQVLTNSGADFAVIELDRPVVGHAPLKIRRSGVPSTSDTLTVIGHPTGLPTKVAGDAKIRIVYPAYIRASLDTYGGNSGSAVFNSQTHEVEGVLVRGENDYVEQGACIASNRCTQNACRGEDVTRISELKSYVPESSEPPGSPDNPPAPPSSVRYKAEPKVSIPDNNSSGVNSSVNASQSPSGRKVSVSVDITHPWRGDLVLKVSSPDGKVVTLISRKGRSADNIIGTFGNGGTLMAEGNLSALSSVTLSGQWILNVSDLAGRDVGRLNSWSLKFE